MLFFKKKGGLKQDLNEIDKPGCPFAMQLLFENEIEMPTKEQMQDALTSHIGEVKLFSYDKKIAIFQL